MRFFFIDLENVRSNGLEGVLSLEADDQVLVFYSENANNLTIPTLENINNSKATVKFINTNFVGSNAMDFQIVSLLGAMIERHKQGFFSIISHDNGFKSALTFCERYFSDYPISVGKFDNIISAIAYDLKHPIKGSAEGGSGAIKKKKKGGSGASKQAERDDKAVITGRKEAHADSQATASSQNDAGQEQADRLGAQEQTGAAPEKKEGRSRRRRRSKSSDTENSASKAQNAAETVSAGPDMQYIYDYLKDMLSVKTIDVYASKIHEALLVANTKDELHKFFKNKCGEDEGEALFKLLHGDFENMKRKARK
ncbi:MAG: hypothetical protein J5739_04015 [Lachnospiraceae bacterium]|nr:hypothetical protein [Lachnospiraceae bacterium]